MGQSGCGLTRRPWWLRAGPGIPQSKGLGPVGRTRQEGAVRAGWRLRQGGPGGTWMRLGHSHIEVQAWLWSPAVPSVELGDRSSAPPVQPGIQGQMQPVLLRDRGHSGQASTGHGCCCELSATLLPCSPRSHPPGIRVTPGGATCAHPASDPTPHCSL